MQKEPLWTVGGVAALAAAVLGVIVAAGVPIGADLREAILVLVGVVAPLVVAGVARSRVYSPASVEKIREQRSE